MPRTWLLKSLVLVGGVALLILLGNLAILSAVVWARGDEASQPGSLPGVRNLRQVDGKLWRGSAPKDAGYEALAARGVRTIVDLRAERVPDAALLERHGLTLERIPMRDGQAPTSQQVRRFLATVEKAKGPVYVHCMAGVGRTGTMAGSYLVLEKQQSPLAALERNLSVGPPSLEQINFVTTLEPGGVDRPNAAVTLASRVLDAPRRIWSRIR